MNSTRGCPRSGRPPTSSGERPSVSWPVQPCPTRTTSPCDLRATWRLDIASPRPLSRIEFDPRVCCQRFHHVAHATRSPGCPSPAPPPKSSPAIRSPPPHNRSPSATQQLKPHHAGWYPLAARRLPGITAPQPARTSLGNPLHHFETPLSVQTFRSILCLQTTTHLCHPTAQTFRPKPLPATLHPHTTSSNPIPENKPLNLSQSRPVHTNHVAEFLKPVTHVSQPPQRHLCRLHLSRKTAQTFGNTLIANRFPRLGPASGTQPGFTG